MTTNTTATTPAGTIPNIDLILASASPRRQELLKLTLIPFRIMAVECDEGIPGHTENHVMAIAGRKAKAAHDQLTKEQPHAATQQQKIPLILAADTVVACDGHTFGKPANHAHATAMLQKLQGRRHRVATGFVFESTNWCYRECVITEVEMAPMTNTDIDHYLTTQRPYDKAGAYGIQDPLMACHIRRIDGCYYNVMGLPLSEIWKAINTFSQLTEPRP